MSEVENVRVIVRIRPFNKSEEEANCKSVTDVDPTETVIKVQKTSQVYYEQPKIYTFDRILKEDSSQIDVYCQTTQAIVEQVFEGYNGTVFAYGQTGTGKTFTMTGNKQKEQRGIIPNTFSHIFNKISNAKEQLSFLVHVTFLEIYNECVRDLLAEPTKVTSLDVREHAHHGVFVQNLSGYVVQTLEELQNIMDIGTKNRVIGATDSNAASSRSHTIFTITLESNDKSLIDVDQITRGKLHLVDLAGSERQSKTNSTGLRLQEAVKINQSLSVLGNVISALVDGKSNHIPYRNSKLTRLLQDSLGGNSKTVMIATISPLENDYEETISTLRYANRAKYIQNRVYINESPKDTLIQMFQNEITELRKQLELISVDEPVIEEDATSSEGTSSIKKRKQKKRVVEEITDEPVEDVELTEVKQEQEKLENKLDQLTNKIIVGGENLLEKAKNQDFLLEVAASQLEYSSKLQNQLESSIQEKEAERIDIEEKYSSLQEEVCGKTEKIKKLTSMILNIKQELADQYQEQQKEMELMLDSVRDLTKEIQLADLAIHSFIPREVRTQIEENVTWNDDINEYQLKYVAHTGNHMQREETFKNSSDVLSAKHIIKPPVYKTYSSVLKKPKSKSGLPSLTSRQRNSKTAMR